MDRKSFLKNLIGLPIAAKAVLSSDKKAKEFLDNPLKEEVKKQDNLQGPIHSYGSCMGTFGYISISTPDDMSGGCNCRTLKYFDGRDDW